MSPIPIRTPIMQHTSAIIKGLISEAEALTKLDHKALKGQLRELFASRLLAKFLTVQYGIGSGVILNQLGRQSKQIDIIVYDRRILPPFIEEQKIGLYPAECVLATIEVRSMVTKGVIREYAESAKAIHEQLYNPLCSHYRDYNILRPLCSLFGFYDDDICKGFEENQIYDWMMNNAKPLFGVCVLNKFSWLNIMRQQGALTLFRDDNAETKAFIAPLLDNIRTISQKRYSHITGRHNDWFSIYTRDQTWQEGEF